MAPVLLRIRCTFPLLPRLDYQCASSFMAE